LATRQALSLNADKIVVVEDLTSKEGKTAELAKLLKKIGANGNVLLIVEQKTPEVTRAAQNIPAVRLVSANYLNVYDVLNADCMVFSQPALKAVGNWLGKEAK